MVIRREHNGGADGYRMHMESSPGIFIPDVCTLPQPFPQDYLNLLDEDEIGHQYARRITEAAIVVFNAEAYCEYMYEDGRHIYRLHAHGFTEQSAIHQQIRHEAEFHVLLRGLIQQLFNYRLNETIKLI